MRAVVQRVLEAYVDVDGKRISTIDQGLMILLGIEQNDGMEDVNWLAAKIARMRIFNDTNGVMNLSVQEVRGSALVVSQFTLHAATKKGNRPSYVRAAKHDLAIPLYQAFLEAMEQHLGHKPGAGIFAADMKVGLVNDGPVTIVIDTQNKE